MPKSLENLSVEEAVRVMRERIGHDGTVALISLLRHSQEEVIRELDARFERVEARIDVTNARLDAMNARIDGTLRYAITFSLSLLGLVAAVATGILAWRG